VTFMVKIALVWVFPEYVSLYHSTNDPYSFSSVSLCNNKENRLNLGTSQKINALSEIGEHWPKSTFTFFVFISLNHKYVVRKPDGKNNLEDPDIDGRIILRWIFWKWVGEAGT